MAAVVNPRATVCPAVKATKAEHKNVEMTKAEAEAVLAKLSGSVESLGGIHDSEMAELQMKVHKYQQALTTLSNIMKGMDDTHKAVLGNVRA